MQWQFLGNMGIDFELTTPLFILPRDSFPSDPFL